MSKGILRKRYIGLFIKILIAVVALVFIYREVQLKDQTTDLHFGIDVLADNLLQLIALLGLMLVNWWLESFKWRSLIKHLENISSWKALKAIFSGVTIAIFTPNRVGEYGGRIFHLQKADRIDAVLYTLVGSYAQVIVTTGSGLIATVFFLPQYVGLGPITSTQYNLVALLTFGIVALLIVAFLNTQLLTVIINRLPIPEKYRHYASAFEYHNSFTLWKALLASIGRYLVFTFQFYMLLHLFGVNISYANAMMMISMTYFVMMVVPTIAITELGVRGSVAVYFLGMLSHNVTNIFLASSMLWLINLAIPALIGVLFIFQLRFFRKPD